LCCGKSRYGFSTVSSPAVISRRFLPVSHESEHVATRAPNVEDVARLAGVSRQTVSNVLNAPQKVTPATAERVQAAIKKLGYRPHASARRLRTRRSATVGVHLDPYRGGISGVLLDRFVHALTEAAGERSVRSEERRVGKGGSLRWAA